MQIGIVEGKDFSQKAIDSLKKIGTVTIFDKNDINIFIEDKDILFIRLNYNIDAKLLKNAKVLKFICSPTTGLNHIDLKTCNDNNIKIISLKNQKEFLQTIRATPEHTFGLILSLLRNYKRAFLDSNNNTWDRDIYKGYELYGKRIGIIGFGRVGSILAKYFNTFDAQTFFYDIKLEINTNFAQRVSSIKELISKSDIVVLSASYSDEYNRFFDKKYVDLLKDKYFINTARGELVDEEYLLTKIEESYFKGIAIDVFQNEAKKNNNIEKFLSLASKTNNLIITSHIAGATYESMWKTEEFIVDLLKEEL
ncbi:hypothetical protein CRV08_06070 [Halarcobacter ebronensis]|uniref:Hydroxyacid dehydrogenase n=1 Tax=Halarcobacter ebronensis TaxID=1462615 RepID=A0A4Q0YFQ5_9BACT|nr:2-hydroxyacid dehydrogenase [Halarcobacter ebronensis]RXJ68995.1 hypothetical protein CRV08_06070 [Halarcobacter ebronensis]